jgi:hypothetical protein
LFVSNVSSRGRCRNGSAPAVVKFFSRGFKNDERSFEIKAIEDTDGINPQFNADDCVLELLEPESTILCWEVRRHGAVKTGTFF